MDGPQRVVLVHVGQPEHRHHGVADELLGPAAQRLQLAGRGVEEAAEHVAGALRVQPLGQAGRVHQVGEQDRDHLPLLRPEQRPDRRPAVRTEASAVGQRATTDRAGRLAARGHGGCYPASASRTLRLSVWSRR